MTGAPPLRFADCHNDLLMSVLAQRERGVEEPFGDFWLPQLQRGGVGLQVLPIYTDDMFVQEAALRRCLLMIDEAYRFADRFGDAVAIVTSPAELAEAERTGRIALVLALEGAEPVGRDLGVLRAMHRAGVRMISLTWSRRTMFADGIDEEDTGGGLTALGKAAIREMEQQGVVLDVSHISRTGFWAVTEVAERPFVASHSSADALQQHPRNLTDAQLAAMRQTGSLVCANAFGRFVGEPYTVDHFVDHIEHLLHHVGPTGAALGIDFIVDVMAVTDAASADAREPHHGLPQLEGLVRPADLPLLAQRLLDRLPPDVAAAVAYDNLAGFLAAHL